MKLGLSWASFGVDKRFFLRSADISHGTWARYLFMALAEALGQLHRPHCLWTVCNYTKYGEATYNAAIGGTSGHRSANKFTASLAFLIFEYFHRTGNFKSHYLHYYYRCNEYMKAGIDERSYLFELINLLRAEFVFPFFSSCHTWNKASLACQMAYFFCFILWFLDGMRQDYYTVYILSSFFY